MCKWTLYSYMANYHNNSLDKTEINVNTDNYGTSMGTVNLGTTTNKN